MARSRRIVAAMETHRERAITSGPDMAVGQRNPSDVDSPL